MTSKNNVVPLTAAVPTKFMDLEGKTDIPSATMINARIALERLGVECSYDEFHDRRYVSGTMLGNDIGQLSDDVCLLIRRECRMRFKFDPGLQHTWEAVNLMCRENSYNPMLDYFESCEDKYDFKARLDSWLIDYAGAPDTKFVRAVSRIVLIAAVRRVRKPGTKFDFMTVLESGEGKNKSLALATLAGDDNFTDQSLLGISDKEIMEQGRGRLFWEAADLTGMRKAEVDRVKAQLSRQSDRGRPSYGRAVLDVPRTWIAFGSTNDTIYLRSQTGNRRFWPVPIKQFDIKRLSADRDQLWGEAAMLESSGQSIGLPESLWADASAEQAARTHHDPWEDELADIGAVARLQQADQDQIFYTCKVLDAGDMMEERITSKWLLASALSIPPSARTPEHTHRLARVMRKLGWDDNDGRTIWIAAPCKGFKRVSPRDPLI